MCNLYDIGPAPARQAKGWERRTIEAMRELPKAFGIRRTDRGLVVRRNPANGEMEPSVMRWGFRREFSDCINNARVDKLDSGTWSGAWRARRCLIPAAAFYEWSGGEKGAKQTYALRAPVEGLDTEWLWIAGIWEENTDLGLCYSMLTTDARGAIATIHDRMPVALPASRIESYLMPDDHPDHDLAEARSDFAMFRCLNPLKIKHSGPPVEDGFLF
jgi:putative SOS response-associated peptidase YedK